jgi:hypothetical protein
MAPGIMCFGKKPIDPESKRNAEIEKQLRADQKRQKSEVKLLLLGIGNVQTRMVFGCSPLLQAPERAASQRC